MTGELDHTTRTPQAVLRSFIDRFAPKDQKLIRAVRAAVRKRFPTANELAYDYSSHVVLAYGPTDRGIDSIVSTGARADGVRLYFNQGPQLPDPKRLLRRVPLALPVQLREGRPKASDGPAVKVVLSPSASSKRLNPHRHWQSHWHPRI